MVRDARTRGHLRKKPWRSGPSVRRGEKRFVFPFQEDVDVIFNSALLYELAVMKPFAEKLLEDVSANLPPGRLPIVFGHCATTLTPLSHGAFDPAPFDSPRIHWRFMLRLCQPLLAPSTLPRGRSGLIKLPSLAINSPAR